MNILYTNFHNEHGGGHTTYICTLLRGEKFNRYVACPPTSQLYTVLQDEGYDKLIPIEFPAKLKDCKRIYKNAFLLKKAIEEYNIDIVHTNGSTDNRMALYIAPITKKFNVIFTKHNSYKLDNFISRLRFNHFNDASIFVGNYLQALKLPENYYKYHIIPNGIDLEYWKPAITPKTDNQTITLISNAGMGRHKGWQHLVEAFEGLEPAEKKRFKVVFLAPYKGEMQEWLSRAEKTCDFTYVGFSPDPRPYLEKADIGFVLSYHEACSFACREMLAMGLPVITSDYPILTNNITQECGWTTKIGDAESIRSVLRHILSLPSEQINAMKKMARNKATKDFSYQKMIAKTDSVYEKICNTCK